MEESSTNDLYTCNGCRSAILADRARVSCHGCPNYHLCANCSVIKQFNSPHAESHPTMVFKVSGFVGPPPPGFNRRTPPPLPPRTMSSTSTKQTNRLSEIPTANWGAIWNVIKAPLEKKDKKTRKEGIDPTAIDQATELRPASESPPQDGFEIAPLNRHPMNQFPPFPPSPPKSVRQRIEKVDSTAPSYPRPAKWELLFEADHTPTPIFVALMSTVFSHLDPQHTGYLSPEVYSGFLDVQGYPLFGNIWKNALDNDAGDASLDVADLELGLHFSGLDISHTLATRHKSSLSYDQNNMEEPTSAVEEKIKESMRFGANMPMLSRQGFIDLGKREYLKDPDVGYKYLKRVVREYGIWGELGEIRRNMLPASGAGEEEDEEEDKPPLPPRGNSLSRMKVDGEEKEVEKFISGDGWEQSSRGTISENPVEITDVGQKVPTLPQHEETMKSKGEWDTSRDTSGSTEQCDEMPKHQEHKSGYSNLQETDAAEATSEKEDYEKGPHSL